LRLIVFEFHRKGRKGSAAKDEGFFCFPVFPLRPSRTLRLIVFKFHRKGRKGSAEKNGGFFCFPVFPLRPSRTLRLIVFEFRIFSEVSMSLRPVKKLIQAKPTLEGAGVHLRRAFGFGNTTDFDPFLLFDDFRNDVPADYQAGFPWHPHRGIETITYVLAGSVEHGDSMGNQGAITAGDVQWMTAGSGIIHQEMPQGDEAGRMHGFQLWANLPSALKMTTPRYQEVKSAEIPEITDDDGTKVRVVCGKFWGASGPVDGIAADPTYLDVTVPAGKRKTLPVETTRHAFAYVFAGEGKFSNASGPQPVKTEAPGTDDTTYETADNRSLVLFDRGDELAVQAGEEGIRFLLVSGKPIEEPVAWHGPIVMNTREELQQAFEELNRGTFLKGQKSS
jgi:redox-sensitive bicupin YhaK (pirin superfamily)